MLESLLLTGGGGGGYFPDSGPGPQSLIGGTINAGFFGEVTATELFKTADLISQLRFYSGTILDLFPVWLKFAYKGKFLFIPKYYLVTGISWRQLYDNGLVYGTDDYGVYPPGTNVNQMSIVSLPEHSFKVRLMHGVGSDPYTFTLNGISPPETLGSEWNDLIYRVSDDSLAGPLPKWATYSFSELASTYYTICQETTEDNVNNKSLRGRNAGSIRYSARGDIDYTTAVGWKPVVELLNPKDGLIKVHNQKSKSDFIKEVSGLSFTVSSISDGSAKLKAPTNFRYVPDQIMVAGELSITQSGFLIPTSDSEGLFVDNQTLYPPEPTLNYSTSIAAVSLNDPDVSGALIEIGGVEFSITNTGL